MRTTVTFSGDYERWNFYRRAGVPFYMRRLLVPGLKEAVAKGNIKYATMKVNGGNWDGWKIDGNYLLFKKILFRGNYDISFEICYNNLEAPKWTRESY
jgi:hypothetical protein